MRRPGGFLPAAWPPFLAAVAIAAFACAGTTPVPRTAAELTNPRLSPDRSQWLVGPIGRIATPEEREAYLALADDGAAAAAEEAFWQRRDPDAARPGNPVRELFDRRANDADRRFAEAGYRGRRSDRGTIYVLYGEPESIEFELNPRAGEPALEVWKYARDAGIGLDGRRPADTYRFVKQGDLTILYRLPALQRDRVLRDLP